MGAAPEVGLQDGGNVDSAVGLLAVFEQGGHGAAHGEAGAVEGVDELRASVGGRAVTNVGPAGLEVEEVGTGRDFDVFALPVLLSRHPDFRVVLLGGGGAHVA